MKIKRKACNVTYMYNTHNLLWIHKCKLLTSHEYFMANIALWRHKRFEGCKPKNTGDVTTQYLANSAHDWSITCLWHDIVMIMLLWHNIMMSKPLGGPFEILWYHVTIDVMKMTFPVLFLWLCNKRI